MYKRIYDETHDRCTKFALPKAEELKQALNEQYGGIFPVNVSADFPSFGISKGDLVLIKTEYDFFENKLMFFGISGGGVLGVPYNNFGELSLQWADGTTRRFKKRSDVKIYGVVVGVIKPFDNSQILPAEAVAPKSETVETGEIAAICSDCGKTDKGTKRFLQGMGWKINKRDTLCVHCW